MTWKFNPPPGWPKPPPNWTPPQDWAPDPSWPVPPPGWQLWVPAGDALPGSPGLPAGAGGAPPPARRRRTWWLVGGATAVIMILGAVTAAAILATSGEDPPRESRIVDPTGPPLESNPVCHPEPWGGAISSEGTGVGTTIPLDALPPHPHFYLTYSYTPGAELDVFQVTLQSDNGLLGALITHLQEGPAAGAALLPFEFWSAGAPTHLDVDTTGEWTLEIRDLLAAPTWLEVTDGPAGVAIFRVELGSLPGRLEMTADHDGSFRVDTQVEIPFPGDLGIRADAPSAGSTEFYLSANTCLVTVTADAPWSLGFP